MSRFVCCWILCVFFMPSENLPFYLIQSFWIKIWRHCALEWMSYDVRWCLLLDLLGLCIWMHAGFGHKWMYWNSIQMMLALVLRVWLSAKKTCTTSWIHWSACFWFYCITEYIPPFLKSHNFGDHVSAVSILLAKLKSP